MRHKGRWFSMMGIRVGTIDQAELHLLLTDWGLDPLEVAQVQVVGSDDVAGQRYDLGQFIQIYNDLALRGGHADCKLIVYNVEC
jgi:hypothetical protein